MLKELFELVKGSASDTVINNPDIPNEQNEEIVAEATNTVASGLRNIVAGGGAQSLLGLFGSDSKNKSILLSNPIVAMMVGHFAGKLINKFGLKGNQASNVASSLIPGALGSLINRSNDPNDSGFSLDNLLSSITGGKSKEVVQERGTNSIQDVLAQLSGGGNSNESGGIMDIIGQLAGGAQDQQQRNGGGLLDLIKGFTR